VAPVQQKEIAVAEIVGALGVPHTPYFPALVEREGPTCDTARFFASLTQELEAMRPDLLVMYDTDHLNTFFFDNLPIFAIGVTPAFKGPNDEPRAVPLYTIKSRPDVASHVRRVGIEAGFDLSLAQEFTVDHSVVVPLHFMTPRMHVPVIPIFVSGHVPPLPSARRCFDLGTMVTHAIKNFPDALRVAILGSGSFSLEVFGPRIAPGKSDGVPDPDWARRAYALIDEGQYDTLIAETTPQQLHKAGNVGGEILNWIAMLASVNGRRPKFIAPQMEQGHAYAAWTWS
jgi:gallate dioxygenase